MTGKVKLNHFIEFFLRQFDNEDRELIIRFRLWKSRWFGYRTAKLEGFTEDGEMILGPWVKHPPTRRLRKK